MAFSSRVCCMVLGIALFLSFTEARDHLVGGKLDAWTVSTSEPDSLNKWAQKNRFLPKDILVWKYDSKKDSVLQVTRDAYMQCNTTNPIAEYKSDETRVTLENPGPHYFISGVQENCNKGEKLIVAVITPRNRRSPAVAPALAPASGSVSEPPAIAPTTGAAAGLNVGVMVVVGVLVGAWLM